MAAEEADVSAYWGRGSGLANWLMDRMDSSWYNEDIYEDLNKHGMGKFTEIRQLDDKSFKSILKKVDWKRKEKNEFVTKFEQDFGAKRFPNLFSAAEDTANNSNGTRKKSKGKADKRKNKNKNKEKESVETEEDNAYTGSRGIRGRGRRKRQRGSDTTIEENDVDNSENTNGYQKTRSKSKTKNKGSKGSKGSKGGKAKTKDKSKKKGKGQGRGRGKSKTKSKNEVNGNDTKSSSNEMKSDGNESEHTFEFEVDSEVLCLYVDGKVYEARIRDRECKTHDYGEKIESYYLHFKNWNSRWDKWVSAGDIFDKNEENIKAMTQLNGKNAKRLKTSSN